MDRALAVQAIDIRDSGLQLVRSSEFQQHIPVSAGLHNSAFFWINTDEVLAEIESMVQDPVLFELIDSREPSLVMVNAEPEQIRIASHSRLRLTSLFLSTFIAHAPGE